MQLPAITDKVWLGHQTWMKRLVQLGYALNLCSDFLVGALLAVVMQLALGDCPERVAMLNYMVAVLVEIQFLFTQGLGLLKPLLGAFRGKAVVWMPIGWDVIIAAGRVFVAIADLPSGAIECVEIFPVRTGAICAVTITITIATPVI